MIQHAAASGSIAGNANISVLVRRNFKEVRDMFAVGLCQVVLMLGISWLEIRDGH